MMFERLKKTAALALCGSVILLSPGASAAQEFVAAARAASALPAPVAVPLTLGAPSLLPAPLAATIPVLGAASLVPALAPAAVSNFVVPAVAAQEAAKTSALPAAAAAASAPVGAVLSAAAAVPSAALAAQVPEDKAARAPPPAGGFSRLMSVAAGSLRFWKSSVSNGALKAEAGRDFDRSADAPASEPSVAAAYSAPGVRGGGLSKPGPRRPRGPPVSSYRWIAAGALVGGAALRPSLAASALAALALPCYYVANIAGSLFPMIQAHEIFKRRSADVSSTTLATGIAASLMLAVNFSYLGMSLAALQNLGGALSFALIAGQKYWYARRPASAGAPPASTASVAVKTALSLAGVLGLTLALGKILLATVPTVALAGTFLVPLQVLGGLGFAYLMLPAYLKIKRAGSVGDSSRGMALTYLACQIATTIWALNQLVSLTDARSLLPLAVFAGATATLSQRLVRWIGRGSLTNAASFLVLAPFLLALVAAGALGFDRLLPIPSESVHKFVAYLLYLVGNIMAATVTKETLRAFREHGPKKD